MRRLPGWLFIVGILGFVGATIVCAALAYTTAHQTAIYAQQVTGDEVSLISLFNAFAQNQPTPTLPPTAAPTNTPEPGVTFTPEPTAAPTVEGTVDPVAALEAQYAYNDPSTRTILLLGIDERTAVDNEPAYRSDTMMLINIDPIRKRVGIVSIPRDLFVQVPGHNVSNFKINQANYLGDLDNYPGGGGPALAAETIRANFGIRVDNYVRINFDVFETVVNTLAPEGVEVCVSESIYDPKYPDGGYGTIEVRFEPGCQKLNATRLLQYARTRATEGGDFDRARRQQEVLRASQAELLRVENIPNLVTQAQTVYAQIANSVKTDLSIDELISLGLLALEIDGDSITSDVIDSRHIQGFGKNAEGEDVVIPDLPRILDLIERTFNPQPDLTLADLRQRADNEKARIVIYNNTDIAGLAGNTRDYLASRQVSIENSVGNIPEPTNTDTSIRDYTGKPWTARYLAALLNIPEERILPGGDGLTSADVMVVVGADIQPLLSGEGQ